MPRVARIVVLGWPHHVVQRGNNRQNVFFVEDDRRAYAQLLQGQAQQFQVSVLGYRLMTNHVHLIVIPQTEQGLVRAVGRKHWHYTNVGRPSSEQG